MVDDEQTWAQPRHRGRPLVIAVVTTSTASTVLLLLPIPDDPRRWVVLGLLVVLAALALPLGVRAWRAGRRPLSPRWMRLASTSGWFWGAFTAGTYSLPILHHSSALESAASGAGAALFFGVVMWFADPGRTSRSATPSSTADSPQH